MRRKQLEGKAQSRKRRNILKFAKRRAEKRRETGDVYWGAERKHYTFVEVTGRKNKKAVLEKLGIDKLEKGQILQSILFCATNKQPNKGYESLRNFIDRVRKNIKDARAALA